MWTQPSLYIFFFIAYYMRNLATVWAQVYGPLIQKLCIIDENQRQTALLSKLIVSIICLHDLQYTLNNEWVERK